MTHDEAEAVLDKLATEMLDHHDRIRAVVAGLPDEDVAAIMFECRKQAQPGDMRNFAIPEWDIIADQPEAELGSRHSFRRAEEHMKATGSNYYCLHCDGDCTPEHRRELGS